MFATWLQTPGANTHFLSGSRQPLPSYAHSRLMRAKHIFGQWTEIFALLSQDFKPFCTRKLGISVVSCLLGKCLRSSYLSVISFQFHICISLLLCILRRGFSFMQAARSWRASGDCQISLSASAERALANFCDKKHRILQLTIFATKT